MVGSLPGQEPNYGISMESSTMKYTRKQECGICGSWELFEFNTNANKKTCLSCGTNYAGTEEVEESYFVGGWEWMDIEQKILNLQEEIRFQARILDVQPHQLLIAILESFGHGTRKKVVQYYLKPRSSVKPWSGLEST